MTSKILIYKGRRGNGKTLSMVKDGYKYYTNGWRILRNFSCNFGEYIEEDDILKLNKHSNIQDCVLMIDELQIFFDSRRSMKKENLNFSNFIQQIRKRNIILLCTVQFGNTIDLRLRDHIDITAYPKVNTTGSGKKVCEVIYIDMTAFQDDVFGNMEEASYGAIVYDPEPLFNKFKTEEMIK